MTIKISYPVKKILITQYFGENPDKYPRTNGHTGIDFGGNEGDIVFSAADGRIKKIGYEPNGYGNYIIIEHDGFDTLYAHLLKVYEKSFITVNTLVKEGEPIAEMGSTGWSSGNHLHFELRIRNVPVNPIPYFKAIGSEFKDAKVRKIVPALNMRLAPSTESQIFAMLFSDESFPVLEETAEWVKVLVQKEVWLYKSYVEKA
jgi:hypothetical protein